MLCFLVVEMSFTSLIAASVTVPLCSSGCRSSMKLSDEIDGASGCSPQLLITRRSMDGFSV